MCFHGLTCNYGDTVTALSGVTNSVLWVITHMPHQLCHPYLKAWQALPGLLASSQRLPAVAVPAELPTVLRNGPASQIKGKKLSATVNR